MSYNYLTVAVKSIIRNNQFIRINSYKIKQFRTIAESITFHINPTTKWNSPETGTAFKSKSFYCNIISPYLNAFYLVTSCESLFTNFLNFFSFIFMWNIYFFFIYTLYQTITVKFSIILILQTFGTCLLFTSTFRIRTLRLCPFILRVICKCRSHIFFCKFIGFLCWRKPGFITFLILLRITIFWLRSISRQNLFRFCRFLHTFQISIWKIRSIYWCPCRCHGKCQKHCKHFLILHILFLHFCTISYCYRNIRILHLTFLIYHIYFHFL